MAMKKEEITLSIIGKNLDSMRFDEMNAIFHSYQQILDRAHLAFMGKDKPSAISRDRFYASIPKQRPGSINWDFVLNSPYVHESVSLFQERVVMYSFALLIGGVVHFYRVRADKRAKGRNMQIRIKEDGCSADDIKESEDGDVIDVPSAVIKAADMMQEPMREMSRLIDSRKISEFRSFPTKEDGDSCASAVITQADAVIFAPPEEIDATAENIIVKISEFDKESGTGKLQILQSSGDIPNARVKFEVPPELYEDSIRAMLPDVESSRVVAEKKFKSNLSGETKISGLRIVKFL